MDLGIWDHLLALFLIVVMPIKGMREYDRMVARLRAGEDGVRMQAYWRTFLEEWGLVALLVALWLGQGRALVDLGLRFEFMSETWFGWGLTAGMIVLIVGQSVWLLRKPGGIEEVRASLANVRDLVPHTAAERRSFAVLSVTAGICEELLYRGFLLAYFATLLGFWPGVLASSVVFGLAHAYQGSRGIVKTGGVGLAMAFLFEFTGGLWAPMLVHAVIDLNAGYIGGRATENWEELPEAA